MRTRHYITKQVKKVFFKHISSRGQHKSVPVIEIRSYEVENAKRLKKSFLIVKGAEYMYLRKSDLDKGWVNSEPIKSKINEGQTYTLIAFKWTPYVKKEVKPEPQGTTEDYRKFAKNMLKIKSQLGL